MNDKCPYCGGILKEGTLYPTNSDKVYWLPEGKMQVFSFLIQ